MSMFEKMFHRTPATAETNKAGQEKQEGKGMMRRIIDPAEKAAKIAMLLALLGEPLLAGNLGEQEAGPDANKDKIEAAKLALGKIIPYVEKNDLQTHTLNGSNVKSVHFGETQELVVAAGGAYVLLWSDGGKYSFMDDNGDGTLDRVVVNNQEAAGDKTLLKNGLYIFDSMSNLAAEVGAFADVKPEKIRAIAFDLDKMEVSYVNAETGESGVVGGDLAKETIAKFQAHYSNRLEDIAANKVN